MKKHLTIIAIILAIAILAGCTGADTPPETDTYYYTVDIAPYQLRNIGEYILTLTDAYLRPELVEPFALGQINPQAEQDGYIPPDEKIVYVPYCTLSGFNLLFIEINPTCHWFPYYNDTKNYGYSIKFYYDAEPFSTFAEGCEKGPSDDIVYNPDTNQWYIDWNGTVLNVSFGDRILNERMQKEGFDFLYRHINIVAHNIV